MKYIGVRGHNKAAISYLLGNTIEYIIKYDDINDAEFNNLYQVWCDDIAKDEKIIQECSDLERVYFDSFSHTIKFFTKLLIGCPLDYMFDEYYKEHMIINLKDFSYKIYDDIPANMKVYSYNELYELMPKDKAPVTITKNIYISLNDFIMYFGLEIMQRFFGANVWVKSLKNSSDFYNSIFDDNNVYKIFVDIKTPAEVTYIKNNGGIIIKSTNPEYKKQPRRLNKLAQDNRYDYEVTVTSNLYDTKEQIINISKLLIFNEKGK